MEERTLFSEKVMKKASRTNEDQPNQIGYPERGVAKNEWDEKGENAGTNVGDATEDPQS